MLCSETLCISDFYDKCQLNVIFIWTSLIYLLSLYSPGPVFSFLFLLNILPDVSELFGEKILHSLLVGVRDLVGSVDFRAP